MKKIIPIIVVYFLLSLSASAEINLKDGSPAKFADYIGKGKATVFEIWSHSCHVCKQTIHHMSDFDAISDDYNAQVVGISLDGPEHKQLAQNFVSNQALEFPNILADVVDVQQFIHQHAPQAPIATPTLMLFSPEGEFAGIVVGPVTSDDLVRYFEEQKAAESKGQENI